MYQFNITGRDFQRGKVRRVGKAMAVIVPKDWEGADVLVVRKGEIEELVNIDATMKKTQDVIDEKIEKLTKKREEEWKKLKLKVIENVPI